MRILRESRVYNIPVHTKLRNVSFSFISDACIRPGKLCYNDVREWIWDILEKGLETGGLGAVPPEALAGLVFELSKM